MTDPARVKKTDPGHARGVQHLSPAQGIQSAGDGGRTSRGSARTAGWGCIDCKKVLALSMEWSWCRFVLGAAELLRAPAGSGRSVAF
jgi:hypothetical protein